MTEMNDGNPAMDNPRPYWIPAGVDFDGLPEGIRAAILDIVNPAYRELVMGAENGLQKSAGVTVVSMLWLEIVSQMQMGRDLSDPRSLAMPSEEQEQRIARHLRLIGTKIKASAFLLRLAEFREKYGRLPFTVSRWARPVGAPVDWPESAGEE